MELLTNGNVDVCLPTSCNKSNVECQKKEIASLARCLQINLGSEQIFGESLTKLRVKRLEELLEQESTISTVSNHEKNIVNNDYDSDLEDILVPLNPELSDLDNCGGSSPSSFVTPPPEKMIKVPGLKEKRKIILTWTSNPCLDETMTEGEEVSSTAPSCSDNNSNSIKEGDISHNPSKVSKLSYSAWKAKREELKLEQKGAEASGINAGNNDIINPYQNETCPICPQKFITKESLFFHFNAVHRKNEEPFYCVECPNTFVSKKSLCNHLLRSHKLRIKRECYSIGRDQATFDYETEPFPWSVLDPE